VTLQPAAVEPYDVDLWLTGYLRTWLAARPEDYAVMPEGSISNKKPATNMARMIVVERDGGPIVGVFDNPRVRIRVWADKAREASDLARLVVGALKVSPGNGPCVSVTSVFGPSPIPDSSQPQRLVNAELRLRCTVL
jgi:hypothetical protein